MIPNHDDCWLRMKFSIFQLGVFVFCCSIALMLTQLRAHHSMLVILFLFIAPSFFYLKTQRWRAITYGGLTGIVVCWAVSMTTISLLHSHLPRPPIRSRYDSGIPRQQEEATKRTYPFVVPVGFLLGATGCLMYSNWATGKMLKGENDVLVACFTCGREVAPTSSICPRCETRL